MAILTRNNIVTNGLVMYLDAANKISYPGTGTTWQDLSGNNNNGTLTNGPTFSTDGGGSIVFDGSNDYVSLSHIGDTTSFSYEVFIKPTQVTKDQMYIGYSTITSHYVRIYGSRAFLSVNANGQRTLQHNQILQNNQFYHIISIYNGVQLKIYVNNDLTSGSVINQTLTGWGTNRIGRWYDADQRSFVGNIYLLRIYNRELSQQEIQQNYNATKVRFGLT
jgi:hypothetical protein